MGPYKREMVKATRLALGRGAHSMGGVCALKPISNEVKALNEYGISHPAACCGIELLWVAE